MSPSPFGSLKRLIRSRPAARVFFLAGGFFSTLWILWRVLSKPSRASYPCVQAAAPLMTGFFLYLTGTLGAVAAWRTAKKSFHRSRYAVGAVSLVVVFIALLASLAGPEIPVYANSVLLSGANAPVGIARGIFPGRVVWVWDRNATNENCTNAFGDGWFMPQNTNIDAVQRMMDDAVRQISGKPTINESWDAIFKDFNRRRGRGPVGYATGERIFIRTNQVSASNTTINPADYSIKNQSRYGMAETSPQVALAVLRHLVNECGVRQEDISIGDPMKHMYKHVYDMWHAEFPNVVYVDFGGVYGRTAPVAGSRPSIFYSDRGAILKSGGTTGDPVTADFLPTVITDATYLIAIPALKAHARGGVTLNGKLHFGSNLRGSATHLHGGLIAPNKAGSTPLRTGYGLFRVQVDLMGHKDLGEKTVLFIVDGLWGGSEANDPPRKFAMEPFQNDWTSSVFVSQDQVALESVCFDFLKAEYSSTNPFGSYPQIEGADDHILQAADSSFWPPDIRYDPENDGSRLGSLGVCEHWNNPTEKKYSRNLNTGEGIELVFVDKMATQAEDAETGKPVSFALYPNYPNPFNASTTISFAMPASDRLTLKIYSVDGAEVADLIDGWIPAGPHQVRWDASRLPSGMYICRVRANGISTSQKLVLMK